MKSSYPLLLVYMALFGVGAALLTAASILLYTWGISFEEARAICKTKIESMPTWLKQSRDYNEL